MFVIGTAGHVDHGKSTLVRALTGIDPDRLREEQERQMTIDLGFAWLTLPSGREVSIVDVPGHEDFIKNMLAGVGGIDMAILVVAADESIMPQTREHLAILDVLQVSHGVVALTKSDLVEDREWIELVQEEVREALQGTVLQNARVIPVSAVTGSGISDLVAEIDRILEDGQARRDLGRPRVPIDRVFTISGFGTVVTGTLVDGSLSAGDEVLVLPGDMRARIRGIQTHKIKHKQASPGTRVALNLSGVSMDELRRGQVVVRPGQFDTTMLFDARLRYLSTAPWSLKHNTAVDLYTGSARVEAHVRLLDTEEIKPGQEAWAQFRLAEPVVVARGDHYVIRKASPSLTLGGGYIVQPHPARRYRRFRPEVLALLETLAQGSADDLLLYIVNHAKVLEARELIERSGLPPSEAGEVLGRLLDKGTMLCLVEPAPDPPALAHSSAPLVSRDGWAALLAEIRHTLAPYHQSYPLRAGMPREELKSKLQLAGSLASQIIDCAAQQGHLATTATTVALAQHRVSLSREQLSSVDRVLEQFRSNPFTPPAMGKVEEMVGADVLQFLIESDTLVKAGEGVLFDHETHAEMLRQVASFLKEHGKITVGEVRDLFGTSRKYALAFLEDLDSRRITKRLGDVRILR